MDPAVATSIGSDLSSTGGTRPAAKKTRSYFSMLLLTCMVMSGMARLHTAARGIYFGKKELERPSRSSWIPSMSQRMVALCQASQGCPMIFSCWPRYALKRCIFSFHSPTRRYTVFVSSVSRITSPLATVMEKGSSRTWWDSPRHEALSRADVLQKDNGCARECPFVAKVRRVCLYATSL